LLFFILKPQVGFLVLAALRRNRKGVYRFLGIGGRGAEVREAGVVMATELPIRVCDERG
jgi:hypothetical protein